MNRINHIVNNLLNQLVDIYERRQFKNPESLKRRIFINVTNKTIPEYFNNSSQEFNEINIKLKLLEETGFILIQWKDNIKDHIIEKVILNKENISSLYNYLKRTPLIIKLNQLSDQVIKLKEIYGGSSLVQDYLNDIMNKVKKNLSIKSLVDLDHLEKLEETTSFLFNIDTNKDECFIREFSVKNFNNSKLFEKHLKRIVSLIKQYRPDLKERNDEEVLEEFNIYTNPAYLRIKGTGIFELGSDNRIDLKKLAQGIAIASSDLEQLKLVDSKSIESVMTVENLTSFFRLNKENTLIIYIGGFHNKIHRNFLKMISKEIPNNRFYHFGDIDIGGILILLDLIEKTGINFKPYLMGLDTLSRYEAYSTEFTQNDIKRLNDLINGFKLGQYDFLSKTDQNYYSSLLEALNKKGRKLEQEALYWSS